MPLLFGKISRTREPRLFQFSHFEFWVEIQNVNLKLLLSEFTERTLDVFNSSEVEQTVLIFVFSLKFCIPHCCLASIPNPKILTFFRIRKVAHVQKTFFDWQTHSAVKYW